MPLCYKAVAQASAAFLSDALQPFGYIIANRAMAGNKLAVLP